MPHDTFAHEFDRSGARLGLFGFEPFLLNLIDDCFPSLAQIVSIEPEDIDARLATLGFGEQHTLIEIDAQVRAWVVVERVEQQR